MYIITPSNINKNIDDIRNKLNQNIKDETFFNTVNKKGMLLGGTAMLLSTFAVTAMPNGLHDIGSTICAGMGLLTVFGSNFVVSNQKRKIKSELENGLSKFLEIRGVKSLSELSDSQKVIKDYDVYLKHGTLFSDEEINDGKTVQDIINNYKEIFELRIKRIEEYTKANPSMLEKRLVATGISENNSALVALGNLLSKK